MSMKDSTRLLLKATPEVLAGWCGPGKVVWGDGLVEDCVIRTIDGDPHFWTEEVCDWWRASDTDIMRFAIHLDLARAECRDRVRISIARAAERPHYNGGALAWGYTALLGGWVLVERLPFRNVMTDYTRQEWAFCAEPDFESWGRFPALSALDPHDDTRLSDGSRLVDALALHAVATEVLHG